MARSKGWVISGVGEEVRQEVTAAADAVGLPVGAWVEQALRRALEAGSESAAPEGVAIEELEAMVRRVVAEELRPLQEALARADATAAPSSMADGSPVALMRQRVRQRRAR